MDVRELQDWIAYVRPDLPGPRVVRLLAERYRGPGTVYSPAEVASQLGCAPESVLATLLVLSGHPGQVLRGTWLYHDDDGEDFALSPDEVAEIAQSQEFYHPLSGDPVYDYRTSIGLVYEAGSGFPADSPRDTASISASHQA